MADFVKGMLTQELTRDRDGHRTYKADYLVYRASADDSVIEVSGTSGLPQYGDFFNDGKGHDDVYAFCTQETTVKRQQPKDGEKDHWWVVSKVFSTKCDARRCKGDEIASPFDTPPEIDVSFVRYTEEATVDKDGIPIVLPSGEFIRGKQNEWDMCRMQIKIKQNVADPQLAAVAQMVDTVNKYTLWADGSYTGTGTAFFGTPGKQGFPPRTVKLSEAPLVWRYCGSCDQPYYYERTLVFDVRFRARKGVLSGLVESGTGTELITRLDIDTDFDTFDRYVMMEGTKVLNGYWGDTDSGRAWILQNIGGAPPDPTNPQHYIRFTDAQEKQARFVMTEQGVPADARIFQDIGLTDLDLGTVGQAGRKLIQFYGESDFSLLEKFPVSLVPVVLGP